MFGTYPQPIPTGRQGEAGTGAPSAWRCARNEHGFAGRGGGGKGAEPDCQMRRGRSSIVEEEDVALRVEERGE